MEILYHPFFAGWFEDLRELNMEVAGEVQALMDELEVHGRGLGDAESHVIRTSKQGLRALRRTPPTVVTPYAEGPPVLRIIYGFADRGQGRLAARILLGGDKTRLGSDWYPKNVGEAERRVVMWAGQQGWRIIR